MDKVDFGKPKPTASAGTYKPLKNPFENPAIEKFKPSIVKDLEYMQSHHGQKRPIGETITQAPAYMSIKTTRPDEQRPEVKKRIDERAHKQIEAEKKARTEEAPKAKMKAIIEFPAVIVGAATGGVGGAAFAYGAAKAMEISDAKAHDKGEMTSIEKTIYEENLYERAHFGTGMSLKGTDDYWFDTKHKTSIDLRKEEIRAEEEDDDEKK
ncbi:MAG: hypothetical protein IJC97_00485 [Oscillospiraceae bacterium]|nr:hypothetical protein [Oscillospiraceae bacterium]